MTDQELNTRLAEALGFVPADHEMFGDLPVWIELASGNDMPISKFNPASDSNDLRKYVFPVIVERRRVQGFCVDVLSSFDNAELDKLFQSIVEEHEASDQAQVAASMVMVGLLQPPRVLAEAALKALEG